MTGISEVSIVNSTFEANHATDEGGALWSGPSLNTTLDRSWRRATGNELDIQRTIFLQNSAKGSGGAVYFQVATLVIHPPFLSLK